jgi:probable DNA repair protein
VLTPNQRLARRLLYLYGKQQLALGRTAWETPAIMPLSAWLNQCYQRGVEQGVITTRLLTELQQHCIWQSLIKVQASDLININECTTLALQAWETLKHWRLRYDNHEFQWQVDHQQFSQWATAYEKFCSENNWLDLQTLPDALMSTNPAAWIASTNAIILFGFDEITPQMAAFWQALQQQQITIQSLEWDIGNTQLTVNSYARAEDEIFAMAQWALEKVQQGKQRIACIIPNLADIRSTVQRIFYHVFYPHDLFYSLPPGNLVNIAGGQPLSQFAIIQFIFQLLRLFEDSYSLLEFSNIILSPFLGQAETERIIRANIDAECRKRSPFYLTLALSTELLKGIPLQASDLFTRFKQLTELNKKTKGIQTLTSWLSWLNQVLHAAGWPGERSLNSEEYQLITHWLDLMSTLHGLNHTQIKLNLTDFIQLLHQTANAQLFQAKTAEAPVQVLGLLEAAGDIYENLWVAGLHDEAWPPPAKPNPFIPLSLQRQYNMPHANSHRQMQYSTVLMQRLLHSAYDIHLSYSQWEADKEQNPSALLLPLLNQHAAQSMDAIPVFHWHLPQQLLQLQQLTYYHDDEKLGFLPQEKRKYAATLLEAQAACPFRAFATYRLNSTTLEWPTTVIERRRRGNVIHYVLEQLWQQWQHSHVLQNLTISDRQQHINQAIDNAIKKYWPAAEQKAYARLLSLEKARVNQLIQQWIEVELQRSPFTVHAVEYTQTYDTPTISFNLRVDRIDCTENNEWLIIDYKTGAASINDWLTETLAKPQLPLYALAFPQPVKAIAFAQINPTKTAAIGLAASDGLMPNLHAFSQDKKPSKVTAPNWEAQLALWQQQLSNLIDDFDSGCTTVKPLHPTQTCQNCHLQSLCRVNLAFMEE